jgi:hypothetical protein
MINAMFSAKQTREGNASSSSSSSRGEQSEDEREDEGRGRGGHPHIYIPVHYSTTSTLVHHYIRQPSDCRPVFCCPSLWPRIVAYISPSSKLSLLFIFLHHHFSNLPQSLFSEIKYSSTSHKEQE